MKRDINFIKHIKPQLKQKEKEDRKMKGTNEMNRDMKLLGIEQKPIDIIEAFSIFKFLKGMR